MIYATSFVMSRIGRALNIVQKNCINTGIRHIPHFLTLLAFVIIRMRYIVIKSIFYRRTVCIYFRNCTIAYVAFVKAVGRNIQVRIPAIIFSLKSATALIR